MVRFRAGSLTLPQIIRRWRFAYIVLVLAFSVSLWWNSSFQSQQRAREKRAQVERTVDGCVSRRDLYDGEQFIVKFIALEAHAPASVARKALADLKDQLRERPVCRKPDGS